MNRLHSLAAKRLDQMDPVAIAIGAHRADQRHIGILHQEASSVRMLHLEWHLRLANDSPAPNFYWVELGINRRRLIQVAAICRLVWRANRTGGIPYGFSPANDCFDAQTGRYLFGPTRHGLTCATFVLAVFHRAGLPLVQYSTWPVDRPGDREWQEKIVAWLKKSGASADHVSTIQSEIGTVRFRPEEVAGAATETRLPVHFDIASQRGLSILERLQAQS